MDKLKYNIIYVNRDVVTDGLVPTSLARSESGLVNVIGEGSSGDFERNLRFLLEFSDGASKTESLRPPLFSWPRITNPGVALVYACATGASCLSYLFQLHDPSMIDLKPTILLIDTPHDERIPEPRPRTRSASPHSRTPLVENEINTPEEEVYGLALLQRVITEVHMRNMAKLVVPVPLISVSPTHDGPADLTIPTDLIPSPALLKRCVDLGAADVIVSPLDVKCVTNLAVQAYKAHKEAAKEQQAMLELRRGRKLSWVGMHEEKPFAYLREAMVSDLMKGICRLGWDADDLIGSAKISVSHERRASIAAAVGCWHFPAHDFADDELLLAAMLMFKHAFSIPELEKWRIPTGLFHLTLWSPRYHHIRTRFL